MGEIGIPRREFLYDLKWWEVKSIIRGYHARHHAGWEQARLIAFTVFCTVAKDPPKLPEDWIRFTWEKQSIPSEDDIMDLKADMASFKKKGT